VSHDGINRYLVARFATNGLERMPQRVKRVAPAGKPELAA
jgi:hypothetical protein